MRHASKSIALSGLAAGLAWLVARYVAGHAVAFFAPAAQRPDLETPLILDEAITSG